MEKYTGNDNYGKPKQLYLDKLAAQSDSELLQSCKDMIWLSAYAANNIRSDYHWKCDACYDECARRGKQHIYKSAYEYNTEAV